MQTFKDKKQLNCFLLNRFIKWTPISLEVCHIACVPEWCRLAEDTTIDFYRKITSQEEFSQIILLLNILFDIYSHVIIEFLDIDKIGR